VKVLPCGDRGLLLEVDDLEAVLDLYASLQDAELPGVTDLVPAACTVLVTTDGRVSLDEVRRRVVALPTARRVGRPRRTVQVPVSYGGPDLGVAAEAVGMSPEALVRMHTSSPWTVAFTGFLPGFAYLVSPSATTPVPRRHEPRTRVPRGSVALGGEFTGIYPKESPGGWQLIGRTDLALFELEREPPALLVPGMHVRFRELR
jgi:KipI family sensor histidine kinase inhibitor